VAAGISDEVVVDGVTGTSEEGNSQCLMKKNYSEIGIK
jgi:hypothetical protein